VTAALTFLRWMAGPQAQWILATQYSEIPANASVRDDPQVIKRNPLLAAAAHARVVPRPATTANYPEFSRIIYEAIYRALRGPTTDGADACTTLATAARRLDPRVAGTLRCARSPAGRG